MYGLLMIRVMSVNWRRMWNEEELNVFSAEVCEFRKRGHGIFLFCVRRKSIRKGFSLAGSFGVGCQEICRHISFACICFRKF